MNGVISIDNRGQILIPMVVRDRADMRDDNKLAPLNWMNRDKACCLAFIHPENRSSEVSGVMRCRISEIV